MQAILTTHAAERFRQRFGGDVGPAMKRAQPMTGSEFRQVQEQRRRFRRVRKPVKRRDLFYDEATRCVFLTAVGDDQVRIVVTCWRMVRRSEFIKN